MSHMNPIHHHECDRCTFLGVYIDAEGQQDLYCCPQTGHPTVLARYGSQYYEYTSGLNHAGASARDRTALGSRKGAAMSRRYPDPHWVSVKWKTKCAICSRTIQPGEQGWYWPASRSMDCAAIDCGRRSAMEFQSAVQDEQFQQRQFSGGAF